MLRAAGGVNAALAAGDKRAIGPLFMLFRGRAVWCIKRRREYCEDCAIGISISVPMTTLTMKSPKASEAQSGTPSPRKDAGSASDESGIPVMRSIHAKPAAKAMEKNRSVSSTEPNIAAANGAFHQVLRRRPLNTVMSSNCARRKAEPEAMAMRGVASQTDMTTPSTKPA